MDGAMSEVVWRVVVARGIDNEDREALARLGASYISGHSGPGYVSSSILVWARDEEQARRKIADALGLGDALIREARAMPVYVYAPISPEAREAFEQAAGDDGPIGGVIEDESTGELQVYFELSPGDPGRAFREARGVYRQTVESAGLPMPDALEMSMSGFETLIDERVRALARLSRAVGLVRDGEHDLAVVVAQTACEVLIREVLTTLVEVRVDDRELQPWLLERVRYFSLNDDQTRDLWSRLAGSRIQEQAFWPEYKAHVDRRHRVVHRGDTVTPEDADASLRAAGSLLAYVEAALGPVPPSDPRDEK
jgi:HEPN domain-containing protein